MTRMDELTERTLLLYFVSFFIIFPTISLILQLCVALGCRPRETWPLCAVNKNLILAGGGEKKKKI